MKNDTLLEYAPDKDEVLKIIQQITKAIGKSDPKTVFIACSIIMQVQSDLMGIDGADNAECLP